jgi:hypothetical protein
LKQGTLYYDKSVGRYDIIFDDGDYYGGLSCGTCFDVLHGDGWKPTRIEYASKEWYLVECDTVRLDGLKVRY